MRFCVAYVNDLQNYKTMKNVYTFKNIENCLRNICYNFNTKNINCYLQVVIVI